MIINISYPNAKSRQAILDVSGSAFSFWERVQLKGIGSGKLQIKESSEEIAKIIRNNRDTVYCNIELRTEGLVLGFNSSGRIYAWCIPYYQLSIYYNSGILSIHGPNNFVKAQPPFNGKINMKFVKKVLKLKSSNLDND